MSEKLKFKINKVITKIMGGNIKIDPPYLENLNGKGSPCIFGSWVKRLSKIRSEFKSAEPFESVVIDNFLNKEYAEQLYKVFPENFNDWYVYENPIEVKYAFDDINRLESPLRDYFYYLSTPDIVSLFSYISGIKELEYDEYLHGAGLHSHPRHGRLQIHLDYEKHPYSGKERRLNIILFLSKDWKEEWNGHNELWGSDLKKCIRKTAVKFNRAIIFKTNDISFHGLPEKIKCPPSLFRKSLAYYYVSPVESNYKSNEEGHVEKNYRKKAAFFPSLSEGDTPNPNMEKLCKIRNERLITKADIDELFPNWTKED